MSKNKSVAWDRKTKGHVTKWTYNYRSLQTLGMESSNRMSRKTLRKRRAKRRNELALHDASIQGLDLNLIHGILELTEMSLDEAKALSVTLQCEENELWEI